jgi:hypothetical protein
MTFLAPSPTPPPPSQPLPVDRRPAGPVTNPFPELATPPAGWRGRRGCWLVRLRLHRRAQVAGTTVAGEPILLVGSVPLVLGTGQALYPLVPCAICGDEVASRSRPLRRPADLLRPAERVICRACCARAVSNQPEDRDRR